jgi:hypothetical protein
MPGSPPIRMREPFTTPPPRTRSSSSSPVLSRCSSRRETSSRLTGRLRPAAPWAVFRLLLSAGCSISSTMVFHSLQEGHLPIHLTDSYPQSWHTNTRFSLAIDCFSSHISFVNRFFNWLPYELYHKYRQIYIAFKARCTRERFPRPFQWKTEEPFSTPTQGNHSPGLLNFLKYQLVVFNVYQDLIPYGYPAGQDLLGQIIFHRALDGPS